MWLKQSTLLAAMYENICGFTSSPMLDFVGFLVWKAILVLF
jgi:hypothetical protein